MEVLSYNMLSIYTGILTSISGGILNSCRTVTSILKYKNIDVTSRINALDISCKLKTIEALLKSLDIKDEQNVDDDPIVVSLRYLNEIIDVIYKDLDLINRKVNYHKTKWFNRWRTLNIKEDMNKLEIDCQILDDRFTRFIEICKIKSLK